MNKYLYKLMTDLAHIQAERKPWVVYVKSKEHHRIATYIEGSTFRWLWLAHLYARVIEGVLGRRCIVQEHVVKLAAKSS